MKRFTISVTLILALALCVFTFASCGKKKTADPATQAATTAGATVPAVTTDSTTASEATAAETTADATAPETTAPATETATEHVHVPEDQPRIDLEPDCTEPGVQTYYCAECGARMPETEEEIPPLGHTPSDKITIVPANCSETGLTYKRCVECGVIVDETIEELPIDPDAHVVTEWDDEKIPHLLDQEGGFRDGVCSLCNASIHEELDWAPVVFDSKNANVDPDNPAPNYSNDSFLLSKNAADIRGESHFYPDETNAEEGNDLWFEYSFLWNETLANWDFAPSKAEIKAVCFRKLSGRWSDDFLSFYLLYTRDNNQPFSTSGDCPFKGHFDYSIYMRGVSPSWACAEEIGNGVPLYKAGWDSPITESSSPAIGEYGWHRIGFRFHQKAEIDNDKGGVVYSGWSELYVDGVKVWHVVTNVQGNWDGSSWQNTGKALTAINALLYTAEIDSEDPTVLHYADNDDLAVEMKLLHVTDSTNAVYVAYDDAHWTCGTGFVRNVEPEPSPVETTITLAEGVTVPATVYFKLAD